MVQLSISQNRFTRFLQPLRSIWIWLIVALKSINFSILFWKWDVFMEKCLKSAHTTLKKNDTCQPAYTWQLRAKNNATKPLVILVKVWLFAIWVLQWIKKWIIWTWVQSFAFGSLYPLLIYEVGLHLSCTWPSKYPLVYMFRYCLKSKHCPWKTLQKTLNLFLGKSMDTVFM